LAVLSADGGKSELSQQLDWIKTNSSSKLDSSWSSNIDLDREYLHPLATLAFHTSTVVGCMGGASGVAGEGGQLPPCPMLCPPAAPPPGVVR